MTLTLTIERYKPEMKSRWDSFVEQSRNATFLFKRDYMDYHADRFTDYSLVVFDASDNIIALLPANQKNETLYSHQGLTYGGFLLDSSMKLPKFLTVFKVVVTYCLEVGFKDLVYKVIPHIYPQVPTQEDLYALYMVDAKLISRSILTVAQPKTPVKWQSQRKRGASKARKNNVVVAQSENFEGYWQLLASLLINKFDTKPVHTLAEIRHLKSCFPENINLYTAELNGNLIAGVLVYNSQQVARAQYIAANDLGKENGALDLIFQFLLNDIYKDKSYFEFGTSELANTENYINISLINQKEGFGARAIAQDTYSLDLMNMNFDKVNAILS